MYCDDDFIFCRRNADCLKTGAGRFLYCKANNPDERLYIHLRRTRETTFYCVYKQIKTKNYKYEYKIEELVTEKEIKEKEVKSEKNDLFIKLRANPASTLEGWEERTESLSFPEEIEFLNSIDNRVKADNMEKILNK